MGKMEPGKAEGNMAASGGDDGLLKIGEVTSPEDFAFNLRIRLFKTHQEAAEYLKLSRPTVGRYESGRITPPIQYLAFLLKRFKEQRRKELGTSFRDDAAFEAELVAWINKLVDKNRMLYPGALFEDWDHLSRVADAYELERHGRVSRDEKLQPKDQATQPDQVPQPAQAEQSSERNIPAPSRRLVLLALALLGSAGLLALLLFVAGRALVDTTLTPTSTSTPTVPSIAFASPTTVSPALPTASTASRSATPSVASISPTSTQPAPTAAGNVPSTAVVCGELARPPAENAFQFLRSQGVIVFNADSSEGAILNNTVRSLAIDERGLWIGYFSSIDNPNNGVGHRDPRGWVDCRAPGTGTAKNINALAVDSKGRVWAAAEHGGVLMYDGEQWHTYTTAHGLPTTNTFGITVDQQGGVWVATWEGIAKFEGDRWTVPYKQGQGTIFSNHTHAIAFQDNGDIWVAHLGQGVSHYNKREGKWLRHSTDKGQLGSDDVLGIAIQKGGHASPEEEAVWFATAKGVSKFYGGEWTIYRKEDGLPDDNVNAVAVDMYNRVWAVTKGGVAYLDEGSWILYHNMPALSIAFGTSCTVCPYDVEHVWTGTEKNGLTHSRVPLPRSEHPIDVVSVRYRKYDNPDAAFQDTIVVAPGEKVVSEIVISPRPPYILSEERGDLLISMEEEDQKRYGAYVQMPVKGTVESGQRFTFVDYDKPFIAPDLPDGTQEQKVVTRYRMWMQTRYVGPVIEVTFTVRRPTDTPAPKTEPTTSP